MLAGATTVSFIVALFALASQIPAGSSAPSGPAGDADLIAAPNPTAIPTVTQTVNEEVGLAATAEPSATAVLEQSTTLTAILGTPSEQSPDGGSTATPGAEAVEAEVVQPDDVQALITATRDQDWSVRWDAVNALGVLADPVALPSLVERALTDENSHPRWRSLWAISAVDPGGVKAILIFRPALEDADPEVARNAAVAIAFFSGPSAIPELLNGLGDTDEFRRWEAVFSLRKFQDEAVVDGLLPLLNAAAEPAVRVRNEVALSLGRITDDRVVPALFDALRNDPSPEVRWRSAMSLGRSVGPESLEELRSVLADETDEQVRKFVEEAIDKASGA